MPSSVALTEVQRRTLTMLAQRDCGPAYLSGLVWPDRETALRRGAAPGTGLVRPMLAILARLRKAGLVNWYAPPSNATRGQRKGGRDPVVWKVTAAGQTALKDSARTNKEVPHYAIQLRMQYLGVLSLLASCSVALQDTLEGPANETRDLIEEALTDAQKLIPGLRWWRVIDRIEVELAP